METVAERAGWVLAGGRSSRMGSDKALLEIDGKPLISVVASRVAAVCGEVALVGDPVRYSGFNMRVIPDHFPGQGPLAGIEAALAATRAEWNLVVACDMPALDLSILEELFNTAADCALPRYADGRVEPLCAVYRRSCHAAIRDAITRGVRKVTDALPPEALAYVQVSSEASFANLNTPEDLHRYRNG